MVTPLSIKPMLPTVPLSSTNEIGIVNFLKGKHIFITGATGFLAKVLIEKILRTVPEVGKIFMLIKGKDEDAVIQRLKNEFIEEELFKSIGKIHGKAYEVFMRSKLVPVVGNVCENNLGIDVHTSNQISNQVHIIINSAANTRFDERYDVAVNTNIEGPVRLLEFAKKCNELKLFLHVSTAYVNGGRKGMMLEKPCSVGVNVRAEMQLINDMMESLGNGIGGDQKMKDFGMDRATIYEWPNTYLLTKAMGEMVIDSKRENLPVVILRPSMILSTYKEPLPGWIQGNKTVDPLLISYGKGHLPGFIGYPETVFDIVPADMVVNAIIAAMAKHGKVAKPDINVYHVSSAVRNPISYCELFEFAYDYFTSFPLSNSNGNKINIREFKYFSSSNNFYSYITNYASKQIGLKRNSDLKEQIEYSRRIKQALYLAKLYEPLVFYKAWFDNSNTKKLMQEMSSEEKDMFGFDVEAINWENYIKNIHLPGLQRNFLREPPPVVGVAARL